ncbi:MAG: hypothetical protein HYV40_04810 [Candidatus Levybacteria bacterium]|nr:hypothetical protein [Candidatus Levybacteria bacterium]
MQKRVAYFPLALVLVLLSLVIVTSGRELATTLASGLGIDQAGSFLQSISFPLSQLGGQKSFDSNLDTLHNRASLVSTAQEIRALRDQFETTSIPSNTLLPAKIIGYEGYLPGVSRPTQLVVDKGSEDGVIAGLAVVYKNNLVGRVVKTVAHRSLVELLSKSGWSLTAKTSKTNADGLLRIEDGDILLQNVVLSDTLEKKDIVVTKGDQRIGQGGFPPDIVVGEIVSVDKKPSSLFQSAKVQSSVDVIHLTTVFIYTTE